MLVNYNFFFNFTTILTNINVVLHTSIKLQEKNLEHLKIGLDVINEATKNFDDAYCIGSGGFGKVYKADLEHFDSSNSSTIDGVNKCDLPRKRSTVAIKRIHNQQGEQGFILEIETLTTCKHDNIISLLGFCYEGSGSMILVYEHASKGSLENYLGNSDAMTNLTWVQRVKICLGIAHGLNYIHNNTDHCKQKMIHRDIKSDNILLGDNWEAKIADFGLSKFHPADQAASTIYINMIAGATHADGHNIIAAKRLDRKSAEGEVEFMTELEILMEYKHVNVIGLVGYCDEENEKLIVYEYASRGSLDKYLTDDSLTWVMRLRICIDIAIGLEFLHGNVSSPEMVVHRDIKSSNILLFDDWKAKITNFGLSLVCPTSQDIDYLIDNVTGTIGYRDPLYSKTGFLTKESDIFSLGAVLFDILCGKLSSEKLDDEYSYLPFLAKQHYHEGKLDDLVFEGIKEQIVPQSFVTFTMIAHQCLHHRRERRPTAKEVVIQLKKALELQACFYILTKLAINYLSI
ncbi:hypothetical protein CTI12_AA593800 [Artemisia annua]|uniref:Protein kinase domain-containing protein n=1 Tax=Artemisia annua TaxID=35608 RepID=A0A2U1KJX7_ARTAN|nr:hypothetical protein CTI12_AA593800 [Artemisia annua]